MAIISRGVLGTVWVDTAGTTVVVPNSTGVVIPSGTLIYISTIWDNVSATTPTITCSTIGGATAINVHAVGGSGATATAGSGEFKMCFKARTSADIAIGATIATATSNQSPTKRAGLAHGWTGALSTARGTSVAAHSTTGSPSAASSGTALVGGDLIVGCVGFENSSMMTGDADTLNGSWSPIQGTFTTGGGAPNTHLGVAIQYKIVNATGVQTFNPTGGVADTSACISSCQPDPAVAQARVASIQLSNPSHEQSYTR